MGDTTLAPVGGSRPLRGRAPRNREVEVPDDAVAVGVLPVEDPPEEVRLPGCKDERLTS